MDGVLAEFAGKFRLADLTVFRFSHWTWSIRPTHCTIGSGVLSLNRLCVSLGALTAEEAGELATAAKRIEGGLATLFQPDRFNYIMLMMVDPHVHFHVIPRYASPRDFGGIRWVDTGWSSLPHISEGSEYQNHTVLQRLREALVEVEG